MLESGLSADAELRERKGGWLVRNWSWAAVCRVLAMALYNGINNRVMELAMKTTTKGMIISKRVQTLDKHSRVETQRTTDASSDQSVAARHLRGHSSEFKNYLAVIES